MVSFTHRLVKGSTAICNSLRKKMYSHQNFNWREDRDEESSSLPWCHFSYPERSSRQNAQCCMDQQFPQQTPWPLQTSSNDHLSSTLISTNWSAQQTASGSLLPGGQYLSSDQEEDATEITRSGPLLLPAGEPLGPHRDDDLSGHMSTNIDLSGTGRQFPNFGAIPQIHVTQVEAHTQYTVKEFEQQYPFLQAASPLQSYSTPHILQNEISPDMNDYSRQLGSGLAVPVSSLDTLTETKQANLELVFNPTTGEQHEVVVRRKSRRSSTSENHHRKLIRSLGGQCPSCKRRKRRVSETKSIPFRIYLDI